nr:30S ribosomal protein S17P [uncultured archaeon]
MQKETKNIGIETANLPKEKCDDRNCPFHGSLKCRGSTFVGTVISTKMHKTAVVGWTRTHYLSKYERYEKRRTKIKAHNPPCVNAKEGDIVKIMECRPLSKTKNFVVIENIGKELHFKEKMEAMEEAKVKLKEKKEEEESKTPEGEKEEENAAA